MNKPKSMFTDEEFNMMVGFLKTQRPQLLADPEMARAEMNKLDEYIEKEILPFVEQNGVEKSEMAINIVLQGRNLCARLIGEDERQMPALTNEPPELPDPLESKHVAVWCGHGEATTIALTHVIPCLGEEQSGFKLYPDISSLANEILKGTVCGVVSISLTNTTQIESSIRHYLKNLPGWNFERAEATTLPPCADFNDLMALVKALGSMRDGTFVKTTDTFDLKKALPSLMVHMRPPLSQRHIVVIDDLSQEVEGIVQILLAWPQVSHTYYPTGFAEIVIKQNIPDTKVIVLLDEDLGKDRKGSVIAEVLQKKKHQAPVVSISGGEKPAYAKLHFQAKTGIMKDREIALAFIKFMNKVFQQAES